MQTYLSILPLALQSILNFGANSTIQSSPASSSVLNMAAKFPSAPEWKPVFQKAVSTQPVTFFQLATVAEPLVPRCRTLTFAGFVGEAG